MARGPKIPAGFKPSTTVGGGLVGTNGMPVQGRMPPAIPGTTPGISNFMGLSGLQSSGLGSTMPQSQAPLTPAMTPNNPSNTPPAPPGADLSSNPFWNDIMNMNQSQWNQIKAKLGIKA